MGPGPSGSGVAEPSPVSLNSQTLRYLPIPVPVHVPAIVKRHAITGSRLGRYAETGQPPGFGGDGWGLARNPEYPIPKVRIVRFTSVSDVKALRSGPQKGGSFPLDRATYPDPLSFASH
ncbi:MAG: hypothetical protein Q8N94_06845 [Methanoregula sp.]|nr:hypothetical protein [Methanoregula sp.]